MADAGAPELASTTATTVLTRSLAAAVDVLEETKPSIVATLMPAHATDVDADVAAADCTTVATSHDADAVALDAAETSETLTQDA